MDKATLLRKMNEAMDDVLVEAAASMMRHKLARARDKGRGGWWNSKECTAKGLREAMEQHTEKGDPVDVMNLAAMVAVREMLETPNYASELTAACGRSARLESSTARTTEDE